MFSDSLVNLLEIGRVHVNPPVLPHLKVDLGCVVAHIGEQAEASEVRNVVEGHLFNSELEASLLINFTKGSLRDSLGVLDAEFSLVAHLLEVEAFAQAHRVRVLELGVLRQLVGVESVSLAERSKAKCLALDERWHRKLLLQARKHHHHIYRLL